MLKCKKCGIQLEENDKFCGNCGSKQENNKRQDFKSEANKDNKNRTEADNKNKVNLTKENLHMENINKQNTTNSNIEDTKLNKQITKEHTNIEKIQEKENNETGENKEYKKDLKPVIDAEGNLNEKLNQDIHKEKTRKSKKKFLIIAILLVFGFCTNYILLDKKSTKSISKTEDSGNISATSKDLNTEKSNEAKNQPVKKKTDGYMLPNSDKKPLTSYDIKNMSKEQLALARNEIFARHGYKFGEPFKSYFESKSWYSVNPNYTDDMRELSPLERHNAKFILIAEGKGENLDPNYDADYYENNYNQLNNKDNSENNKDYNYIQSAITGYLKNMTEAINRNDYSIVSPYILSNSKLEMYQKKLINNLNSQNVREKWMNVKITNIQHVDNGVYQVSTHETYIIYSGGKETQKEFDYVYTVVGSGTRWWLSDIKTL